MNGRRGDAKTLAAIALVLGVPVGFFARATVAAPISVDACHFRTLRSASQRERRRLISMGTLLCELVDSLEEHVEFPTEQVTSVARPVRCTEDIELCANEVRTEVVEPEPAPIETELTLEVAPPAPPLSQREIVAALRDKLAELPSAVASSASDDRSALLSLANHVTIAATTPSDLEAEIAALDRATADARIPQWKKMSESAQVRWVTILVAWAKALEEEARAKADVGEVIVNAAFRRLRGFSKYDSPGYIHGFARDAQPDGESWRATAAEMLAGLRGKRDDAPVKTTTIVRDDEAEERESKVPEDWPYWRHVRGKNVVMVGGEIREERRVALEEAFQCASLTWLPHNRQRQLASLVARAAQGTVDLVLVNKFVSHKDTAALQQKATVPVVTVRLGYGVTAIKVSLEDYFSRRE